MSRSRSIPSPLAAPIAEAITLRLDRKLTADAFQKRVESIIAEFERKRLEALRGTIVLVTDDHDGRVALYRDGHLVHLGDDLPPSRLLELLNITHTHHRCPVADPPPRTVLDLPGFGG